MIGVLIAYFIGLGGTIFGPHGMQPPLASTKFPYFFWEYMRDKFHSIIGKRGICFARRCGYCVDSHIILKEDMALWYIIVWHS